MRTQQTIIKHLNQFFSQATDDEVSLEQVFESWDRSSYTRDDNMQWLSNKLTPLRKLGYVESIKEISSLSHPAKLTGLRITTKGKEVLGMNKGELSFFEPIKQAKTNSVNTSGIGFIKIQQVKDIVEKFNKQDPGVQVVIDLVLK